MFQPPSVVSMYQIKPSIFYVISHDAQCASVATVSALTQNNHRKPEICVIDM